jgi:hypothetical protein
VSLDVQEPPARAVRWLRPRASLFAAAALVLLASSFAVVATAVVYQRMDAGLIAASRSPERLALQDQTQGRSQKTIRDSAARQTEGAGASQDPATKQIEGARGFQPSVSRQLPADAVFTILVGSYPIGEPTTAADVVALTDWLESSGFVVFYADVDLGARGRWQRVLAGAYTDPESARRDADRLKAAAPQSDARLVSAGFASGIVATVSHEPDAGGRRSGTEP